MHAVNPGSETNYKIVECQNPFCSICTKTADGSGAPPSPLSEGIVVYTCSNPSCSLCDGDYSLLLDIVNPTLAPTEECFLQQYSRSLRNTTTVREEIQPKDPTAHSAGSSKRKLSAGHVGYASKSKRHSTNTKPCSDEMDSVDEILLMNLAMELELDKVQCLPDLQKDVIIELCRQ